MPLLTEMWCLEQGYSSVFCSHTDTWTGFLPPPPPPSPCWLSVPLSPPKSIFPPVFYLPTPNSLSPCLPPSPRSSPPICSHFRLHSSVPVSPPHHLLLSSLVAPSFWFHGHQENHSFNSQHSIFLIFLKKIYMLHSIQAIARMFCCFLFLWHEEALCDKTLVSHRVLVQLFCPPESPSSLTLI